MFKTIQNALDWAKVATNGIGVSYSNMKFSEDGAKIIVHSSESISTILIVNSADGTLLNSRTYSKSYFNLESTNYQFLLMSSTYKGVVYSLSRSSYISCGGHQLFLFDATQTLPSPTWALSTTDPTCLVMGIEFGRGENSLYALGVQDGLDIFFLDAADGSYRWSYKLLNSVNANSNYLDFNPITSSSDMIVFTAI